MSLDPVPVPSRSGSERRQRVAGIRVRLLDDERVQLEEKARAAGMSLASFMRAASLGNPGIRSRRAPPVNAELLAQTLAQLRKAGSNLNQIAHVLNAGKASGWRETAEAITGINAAVMQILDITGRKSR